MSRKIKYLMFFILLLFFSSQLCFSQDTWELVLPPSPTSNQLVSLDFIDEMTGWAVGEYGTILKTTDAGENWRIVEIPQLNYLLDVYFPTPSTGYIVGKDGIILKSVDAGESWFQQPIRFSNNLNRVRFRDENSGWIVGEKGLILFTNDGGQTWTQQLSNSRESLNGLALIGTTGVCAVGGDSTILVTYDDGQNWQRKTFIPVNNRYHSYNFKDVYFLDASRGWIGGWKSSAGIIISTTDGGVSWREFSINDAEYTDFNLHFHSSGFIGIQQILFIDWRYGFCLTDAFFSSDGGGSNLPFYTKYAGRKWYSQVIGSRESSICAGRLAYLSENRIICTGYRGEFRISADKGVTWGFPNHLKRNFDQLLVGNHGQLLAMQSKGHDKNKWSRSKDYGKNWQNFTPQFFDQSGNTPDAIYYGFPQNFLNHGETLRTIGYYHDNIDTCSVYESKDNGLTWHLIHNSASNEIAPPTFLTPDTLVKYLMFQKEVTPGNFKAELVFTYSFDCGRTATTEHLTDVWNKHRPTYPFVSKHYFFNGHSGFLVGSEGNIIKTNDTGRSWENISSGVTDDLWDITFINRQVGFVVGGFGRILKTTDGGATWRKTDSGTQENIYSIGFRNDSEGWAGTKTGLLHTTDTGETWQRVPMRYYHGAIRGIEFDKEGNGYAFTYKFLYPGESWNTARPGGYILLLTLKNGTVSVAGKIADLPQQFSLSRNYPNPFNSSTRIGFHLAERAPAVLQIYNIQGQLVRTLLDKTLEKGEHEVIWDGTTDESIMAASGVYIYRLAANGKVKTRKLLLLR